MKSKAVGLVFLLVGFASSAWAGNTNLSAINRLIHDGSWNQARQEITRLLRQDSLSYRDRQDLLFLPEIMRRIELDFTKTREQVLAEMREIAPEVTPDLLSKWERQKSVEYLDIDGRQRYFNRTAGNVFRVNVEARELKARHQLSTNSPSPFLRENLEQILAEHRQIGRSFPAPKRMRITYRLTVKPDAVPAGETIRVWLPFPQANDRQKDIQLVSSEPERHLVSGITQPLSSVYLEKAAPAGKPTPFAVVFDYTASGFYQLIDPALVKPARANDPVLAAFLAEQPPHIVFTEELKQLSRRIVGEVMNPYLQARLLFQWICLNIPWAGAREYSTIDSLSQYALEKRWGDCGIQTMLFMTLCRFNGIPARWESGWITGQEQNMHDWCQIYLEPYGWLPVDCSFGLMPSQEERIRWFYLGNTDSYRLTINSDFSQPLYPVKVYRRSEPVDFQRGEVEWRGGNLYLNQWTWDFQVVELPSLPAQATK